MEQRPEGAWAGASSQALTGHRRPEVEQEEDGKVG